jgi:hypothetical protein
MTEISDLKELPYICSSLQLELLDNIVQKLNSEISIPDEIQTLLKQIESNGNADVSSDSYISIKNNLLSSLKLASDEKLKKIRDAWDRFSKDELEVFKNRDNPLITDTFQSTEDKISDFCKNFKFRDEYISTWEVLLNKVDVKNEKRHGTALFLLDLERDLSLLTNRGDLAVDDGELKAIQEDIVDTLRSFSDPYKKDGIDFNYEISSFDESGFERLILNQLDVFSYLDFSALEHKVEGEVDEKGWFRGTITAFGIEHKNIVIQSNVRFTGGYSKVGAFKIAIGSYEHDKDKTTHDEKTHEALIQQSLNHGGLMILRDGLRVLPYGRTDNDFFKIEERRGKHAGRYFWASRRMFGQINLNQIDNKNLKDKAGREGFIKNQPARELQLIVIDHLKNFADKYFGSKSGSRQEMLHLLLKEKEVKKSSQKQANRTNLTEFRNIIKNITPILTEQVNIARDVYQVLESKIDLSFNQLESLIKQISDVESMRGELKTPAKPAKINEQLEDKYRYYRDEFSELTELVRVSREKLNKLEVEMKRETPVEVVQKKFNSNQALLNSQVSKYEKLIESKLNLLNIDWKKDAVGDRKKFNEEAINILDSITKKSHTNIILQ